MSQPTVADLLAALAVRIPFDKAASWDVSGLHLGDPAQRVSRVAVAHEVTEAVVDAVDDGSVDLLVAYHPLVFRPTNRLVAGRSPVGRAHRLTRAGVSMIVAHTAFDAAPGGMADALAEALELSQVVPFGPVAASEQVKVVTFLPAGAVDGVVDAMAGAGGGAIGNYAACHFRVDGLGGFDAETGAAPVVGRQGRNREGETRVEMIAPASRRDRVVAALVAAHPYEEPAFDVYPVRSNEGFIGRLGVGSGTLTDLEELVRVRLSSTGLRTSGGRAAQVRSVAVLPGSGGSFFGAAADAGADVLVTGDVGHHAVIESLDRGMAVIDPGHAATERPGMRALLRVVEESIGSRVDVIDLTDIDPTPWR